MKYIQIETQEAGDPIRNQLNTLLGYDDGKGTEQATGPAEEGADGLFYLTVREKWLPDLDPGLVVVDDFERIKTEDMI